MAISNAIDKRAAMRERIAELAVEFLRRGVGDAATARELSVRLNHGDASAFKELERLVHRIVGTGASLGFSDLSDSAAAIERLVERQPPGDAPDVQILSALNDELAALDSHLHGLIQSRE